MTTAPFLGVLALDTAFPRILGDAGNAASYAMPVRLKVVAGADVPKIVRDAPPPEPLVLGFLAAARDLEREGAVGLVTTCGFLVRVQARLAGAVSIPVLASALSLAPVVLALHGGRRLGVLTADAAALGSDALAAAGLPAERAVVVGLEDLPVWRRTILATKDAQARDLDSAGLERAVAAKARALLAEAPDIGAILLECGNLPPYAGVIAAAAGRPVYSILDGAALLWSAARNATTASGGGDDETL